MIAATILLLILAWGVIVFGLRGATTREQVNRTLPALIVFGALSLLTAFFAFGDYLDAILPNRLEAIETQAQFEAQTPLEEREQVLIVGQTAGLIEFRVSDPTDITLTDDTPFSIRGSAYMAGRWDINAEDETRFLNDGSPVVVLAVAEDTENVVARYIFQGTYDEYIDFIPRFTVMPLATMIFSVLLAAMCFGLPVLALRRIKHANR